MRKNKDHEGRKPLHFEELITMTMAQIQPGSLKTSADQRKSLERENITKIKPYEEPTERILPCKEFDSSNLLKPVLIEKCNHIDLRLLDQLNRKDQGLCFS